MIERFWVRIATRGLWGEESFKVMDVVAALLNESYLETMAIYKNKRGNKLRERFFLGV